MGMSCGIIGLPNVGKSTIFNALTGGHAQMAEYAFCTINPNYGMVAVPDERLKALSKLLAKKDPIPTRIEFVDVAGLIKGASQGEGLGNKFLDNIRNADALIHVVRGFHNPDVAHPTDRIDPRSDIETVNTELMLADIQVLERAREKSKKMIKSSDKTSLRRLEQIEVIYNHLNQGKMLKTLEINNETEVVLKELGLITNKPLLYIVNVDEGNTDGEIVEEVKKYAEYSASAWIAIAGKIEEEISELSSAERAEYLKAMGIEQSGLEKLILAAYELLNLITFYTLTTDLQAWTLVAGTKALQAAGKIHTDFEKGFIRAEVFHYTDIMKAGSEHGVREQGLLRLEGREYVVKDGDVIHFLFNV